MAKAKKITTATILKAMDLGEEEKITVICGAKEDPIDVVVKSRLSLTERMSMIDDIANMVFITNEDGEATYCPAFKRFAIEYCIVNYFTDITLPKDSEKTCEFLEKTGISRMIAGAHSDGYIGEIVDEATELIEYRKQEALKASKIDPILSGIVGIIKTVNDKLGTMELLQIMEYIHKNVPGLNENIEQFIRGQAATSAAV